jgi:1-acyl-sn-glycerol-3-phosphate acyltransferase
MIHDWITRAPRPIRGAARTLETVSRMGLYVIKTIARTRNITDPVERRRAMIDRVHDDTSVAMKAMGFEIEVVGLDEELMRKKNFLIVSNHMSYMDILVMSSVRAAVFITSIDMGQVPVLGYLADLGGSLFVERRNRSQIDRDLSAITRTLKEGFNVVIYPEGTSSNGQQILPFKKSLLMAAVEANVDILPVVLKYVEIDGEKFGPENCDRICWYGDMSFAPHLLQVMQNKNIKVRLEFLKPIPVTSESTRHDLAEQSYAAIHKAYFTDHLVGSPQATAPNPMATPKTEASSSGSSSYDLGSADKSLRESESSVTAP